MQLAFSTLGCPDWSFERVITAAREYGYQGVELRFLNGSMDLLEAKELSSRSLHWLQEMEVEICCLASSVRFDDPDSKRRKEQVDIGKQWIDRAHEMGIPFVRVFGDKIPDANLQPWVIEWVTLGLQSLGDHASGSGVAALLESHGDFAESAILRRVMEGISSKQAGILWDTHHPWRFHGETADQTVKEIGKWVRHTHWKDSVAKGVHSPTDEMQRAASEAHHVMSAHRHADYVLFGEGEFPVRDFLSALNTINYTGWFTLEWEKKWHPEIEEPEIAFPHFVESMKRFARA